jgi:cell division protein FtsB
MVVGALVTLAVLLLVIILGDNGVVELDRLRETRRTLIEENAALTRENLHLYRTIDRLQNDPTFVENVARRELGMIRPDELIFQFKSEAQKK